MINKQAMQVYTRKGVCILLLGKTLDDGGGLWLKFRDRFLYLRLLGREKNWQSRTPTSYGFVTIATSRRVGRSSPAESLMNWRWGRGKSQL